MTKHVTAGVLLIGDELLSGRTRDINLQNIANFLAPYGIEVSECRVVRDEEARIVAALNELRAANTYVFTTGGIGPTHDDITADAVARAFGASIDARADARAILQDWYDAKGVELTEARLRMARIPDGAKLVANPVSGAPGFQMENVFVMAGVPAISKAMLEDIGPRLETGQVMKSCNLRTPDLKEGVIGEGLRDIAKANLSVSIGSYPWYENSEDKGVNILIRGVDEAAILAAREAVASFLTEVGYQPEVSAIQ